MVKQKAHIVMRWMAKHWGIIGVLVVSVSVVAAWLAPRAVTFSYHQPTCFNRFVIAPGLFKSKATDGYRLEAAGVVSVGGQAVFATKACVVPVDAPRAGVYTASMSLFGWDIVAKLFTVTAGSPPVASAMPLTKKIPVTIPLVIPLSGHDTVFSYQLAANEKRAGCNAQGQKLSCDVQQLGLAQGVTYAMSLERYFGDSKVATVVNRDIQTLPATTVTATSIKPTETVYSKPTLLQLTFDKEVKTLKAELVSVTGTERKPISVTVAARGKQADITWPSDLARAQAYELVVKEVRAEDGSGLVAPYQLPFYLSGGPKVTNINIGMSKVASGQAVVVTFDQPLSEKQDMQKVLALSGGVTLQSVRGNQATFSTAGIGACADFGIAINDALLSSYDVAGGSKWSRTSRTMCHTVSTIGASVKGRAITAYTFGSGPVAIVYTGAIHGSEASSRSLMVRWIDELEANARAIPADKTIIVIPAINPDGLAAGSRTNANNVDLNRNFATSDWKKDITTTNNKPFPNGGGVAPMSEPETKALAAFIGNVRPQLVVSYHSIGGLAISNQYGIGNARAATYASLSGYRNTTGQSSATFEYAISGTADDYYAEKLGVAAVLIELGSHTDPQFSRNQKAMWEMMK